MRSCTIKKLIPAIGLSTGLNPSDPPREPQAGFSEYNVPPAARLVCAFTRSCPRDNLIEIRQFAGYA